MLTLLIAACAVAPPAAPEATPWSAGATVSAAPGELALTASGGVLGGSLDLSVTGAQAYEEVVIVRSVRGIGDGPCLGLLGGACLDIAAPATRLGSIWTELDGSGTLDAPLSRNPALEGREVCLQAVVVRGLGGMHSELAPPVCILLGRDSDEDGTPDVSDPCPDDPVDACLGPFCERFGWKEGAADWSCPPGTRLPTSDEWDEVEPCFLPEDEAMFSYYHDVAIEVGGCNCKWNGSWCGQPSIETIREGRMCGDYAQLHMCVPD